MDAEIYPYVIGKLEESKGRWSDVAERTGISKRTIEKVARKEIASPSVHLIQALANHFRTEDGARQ